jgi:hypothetical protein
MEDVVLRKWEFNALVLEVIVLVGIAVGAGCGLLVRAGMPDYIVFPLSFAAIGLVQIPITSVYARTRGGELSVSRSLLWIIVGTAVGAAVYVALSRST